jgi:Immunity protein 8
VNATLRGIYSPDLPDLDPEDYQPSDPECFSLAIGAYIGPSEPPLGEEEFAFTVCTAAWLAQHPPPKGFEFLRGTLLLSRWDYPILKRAISDLCLHAEGATWNEVAEKLKRYAHWPA